MPPDTLWSDSSFRGPASITTSKARSMENAQTLGLYTPRRANGGRGGRGGRHSRYDRGTTAQQNDEQSTNYNVAANATMAPFGHVPRYQPQMVFDNRGQPCPARELPPRRLILPHKPHGQPSGLHSS